jgi:hypothetical protein
MAIAAARARMFVFMVQVLSEGKGKAIPPRRAALCTG